MTSRKINSQKELDSRKNSTFTFNLLHYVIIFSDRQSLDHLSSKSSHLSSFYLSSFHVNILDPLAIIIIIIYDTSLPSNFSREYTSFQFAVKNTDKACEFPDKIFFCVCRTSLLRLKFRHARWKSTLVEIVLAHQHLLPRHHIHNDTMDEENLDYEPSEEENQHALNASDPSFNQLSTEIADLLESEESEVTDDEVELMVSDFACVCNVSSVEQDLAHRPNVRPHIKEQRKEHKTKGGLVYVIRPPPKEKKKELRHRKKTVAPPLPPRVTYSIKTQAQTGNSSVLNYKAESLKGIGQEINNANIQAFF